MTIRKAERKDIGVLLDIYNHEVLHGVSTLDINARTTEQWTEWYENHNIKKPPSYCIGRRRHSYRIRHTLIIQTERGICFNC